MSNTCRHCGLPVHAEDWLNTLVLCDAPGQKHRCPAKRTEDTVIKGTRLEGTLLDKPVKRMKPKSMFLRKLERAQKAPVQHTQNVTPFRGKK